MSSSGSFDYAADRIVISSAQDDAVLEGLKKNKQLPRRNQDDAVLEREEEQATTKAKCGGLSTAAAQRAAFCRDDDFIFVLKETWR